jgi:hypothetical protein
VGDTTNLVNNSHSTQEFKETVPEETANISRKRLMGQKVFSEEGVGLV